MKYYFTLSDIERSYINYITLWENNPSKLYLTFFLSGTANNDLSYNVWYRKPSGNRVIKYYTIEDISNLSEFYKDFITNENIYLKNHLIKQRKQKIKEDFK